MPRLFRSVRDIAFGKLFRRERPTVNGLDEVQYVLRISTRSRLKVTPPLWGVTARDAQALDELFGLLDVRKRPVNTG